MKKAFIITMIIGLLSSCATGSDNTNTTSQVKTENVRNNSYGDIEILNYCLDKPYAIYTACRSFSSKVRNDKAYEWKIFQSLRLSIAQKKARVESQQYNNTVLVSDLELMRVADQTVLPQYGKALMAGRMNMNSYFCGAGVNNYSHQMMLSQDKLYKDCLHQLDFSKKAK